MPDGELHTGDLATVDADGYIYVVDRQEDFIKSWGFRIASQDVESTAIQLTELVAVAVVGVPDDAAGERVELVAVKRPNATSPRRTCFAIAVLTWPSTWSRASAFRGSATIERQRQGVEGGGSGALPSP